MVAGARGTVYNRRRAEILSTWDPCPDCNPEGIDEGLWFCVMCQGGWAVFRHPHPAPPLARTRMEDAAPTIGARREGTSSRGPACGRGRRVLPPGLHCEPASLRAAR